MVLTYEGKDHGGHIRFKRESGEEPLMDGRILWEKHIQRDFQPRRLGALTRVVESRQLREILLRVA
jgi:hypothetical protein